MTNNKKPTEKCKEVDLVEWIAINLSKYPVSEVLSAPMLISKFDGKLIENFLSYFSPQNFRFVFKAMVYF